ncbi:DER1 [Auxenochlorella protothecoides x Auxenochlorella symbiontica]|uniref:Derlin n=2 Tax=Auxenochlorella protothecoides TaxID=3075 RepID=A0A1D1ZS13_AUXPR
MPPRAFAGINDGGPAAFYWGLPPMTRLLLTCFLVTGLGALVGVLPYTHMYLDWHYLLRVPPQVWRLLLNFTFIGSPSFGYLIRLIWLVQYGGQYERAKFAHSAADAATMLLFGMASLLLLDLALPPARIGFHGLSLLYMLVYAWSRANPTAQVSFMGLLTLPGLYLPGVFVAMDLLQGQSVAAPLLGIAAGHLYYFLTEVYPLTSGRHIIQTPQWLARAISRWGLGAVPIQQVNPVNPSDHAFRAFTGSGRRLAG